MLVKMYWKATKYCSMQVVLFFQIKYLFIFYTKLTSLITFFKRGPCGLLCCRVAAWTWGEGWGRVPHPASSWQDVSAPGPGGPWSATAYQFVQHQLNHAANFWQQGRPAAFHLQSLSGGRAVGCPNIPKLWVGWSLIVANAVFIPREWFPKISEFMKRNWPGAARI